MRIATWNVHDLFDTVDDPEKDDTVLQAGELQQKLDDLATVLTSTDADVVAVQEVENEDVLRQLATDALTGLGYDEVVLVPAFDPRGINVGLFARRPVVSFDSHLGERFPGLDGTGSYSWSRDCLEVHFRIGGRDLALLVNHLISQTDSGNDDRRAAQARRVRAIADEIVADAPDALVAALGDMNDTPGSATIDALLGVGDLMDAARDLPADASWTFLEGNRRERLDWMAMTPTLVSMVTDIHVVYGGDVGRASDHQPVVVDLLVTPP